MHSRCDKHMICQFLWCHAQVLVAVTPGVLHLRHAAGPDNGELHWCQRDQPQRDMPAGENSGRRLSMMWYFLPLLHYPSAPDTNHCGGTNPDARSPAVRHLMQTFWSGHCTIALLIQSTWQSLFGGSFLQISFGDQINILYQSCSLTNQLQLCQRDPS
jgi:hypothetical protein